MENNNTSKLLTLAQQDAQVEAYNQTRSARILAISQNKSNRMKGLPQVRVPHAGPVPHRPHAYCAITGEWIGRAFKDCNPGVPFVISGLPYNQEPTTLKAERLAWLNTPKSAKVFAF